MFMYCEGFKIRTTSYEDIIFESPAAAGLFEEALLLLVTCLQTLISHH